MGDDFKPETLVLQFNGIASIAPKDYLAYPPGLRYSIQYDNILPSSHTYLDLFIYFTILTIALVCSGLLIFHLTVILFTRLYLYRFSMPQFITSNCTTSKDPPNTPITSSPKQQQAPTIPGVSIIKPLTGVDDAVLANLRSFFYMDYPSYELLFCVADMEDPVVPHVQSLISEHPHVDARLIFSANMETCVNPKINNMNPAYMCAKHELVLISDVGIYMYPNTLADMVITMLSEDGVGLVHQIPFMLPYNFSQNLVKSQKSKPPSAWIHQLVYFGCWHAKMYMGAAMLGINCTTGMSCLMRKDALDSIGGLKYFGQYLAEDFFFSKFFHESGWKVLVASQPAWQHAIVPQIRQFQDRMLRWYQLRLAMVPVASLLEPFSGCFINGVLHSFCYSYLFPQWIDPVAFFLCHVLVWFLLDFIMLHQIHPPGAQISISKTSFLAIWTLYESTAIFTQFRAFFTRDIHWRGKQYRLAWGGLATRIDKEASCAKLQDFESSTLVSVESESLPLVSSFDTDFSNDTVSTTTDSNSPKFASVDSTPSSPSYTTQTHFSSPMVSIPIPVKSLHSEDRFGKNSSCIVQ